MDYLNPVVLIPALAILCAVYNLVPRKFRWMVLLGASWAFYFWVGSWAVLLLAVLTLANYYLGLRIEANQGENSRKLLALGVFINLVSLVFFKYGDALFFQQAATATADPLARRILLPLGMSFYTLQNLAYLLDVSKKVIPAERHLGIFALFIAFFPKVASGPIERGKKLLPQLHAMPDATSKDVMLGFRQVIFGLFKKLVIADRLAIIVNQVFGLNGTYNGLPVILAVLFLAFQIYFDFAGYTDIAIGAARLFGIELSINFKRPYLASDVADFWNRWHLSFSTWLRDYIFYPVRRFLLRRQAGTSALSMILPPLVTMLLSGAWHGAGWNFIAWGLYHAVFYIISLFVREFRKTHPPRLAGLTRAVDILVNFGVISFGWIIFRLETFADMKLLVYTVFSGKFLNNPFINSSFEFDLHLGLFLILLAVIWEVLHEFSNGRYELDRLPLPVRWSGYILVVLAITILGVFNYTDNPFVYFKF